MTVSPITNAGIQALLTSSLQSQQAQLTDLTSQLSSQKLHSNLTDYDPAAARNILSIQNVATQKQAYINVINTVSTKLSVYDTTMTDMESIVAQAQGLANQNPNYSAGQAQSIAIQATNYLKSIGVDLNQQLNGQYIYGGTRYTTQPVNDLSALPTSTLSPTIYTDGSSLPSYDSGYSTSSLTESTAGQAVTIGGTVATGQSASITINGKTYSYVAKATDTTTANVAAGLEALVAADIPGTSLAGSTITVGPTGTINATATTNSSTAAYATESATVDTGYVIDYGVTSNNPAFQQLIAGLRYLQKAGNDTSSATYSTDINQATTLLTNALTSMQNLHTSVAYNINLLANEKKTQQANIGNLTEQLSNIQSVDVTQVSAEITSLQTILQASYMVTGTLEKLSIVSYL